MVFKWCRNGKPMFQNLTISLCNNCCAEQDPGTRYGTPSKTHESGIPTKTQDPGTSRDLPLYAEFIFYAYSLEVFSRVSFSPPLVRKNLRVKRFRMRSEKIL